MGPKWSEYENLNRQISCLQKEIYEKEIDLMERKYSSKELDFSYNNGYGQGYYNGVEKSIRYYTGVFIGIIVGVIGCSLTWFIYSNYNLS